MRILVTGANGFVGRRFFVPHSPLAENIQLRGAARTAQVEAHARENIVNIGNIGPDTDWTKALQDINVVIHLAARVHIMHDTETNPSELYRQINTDGTLNLARQAIRNGVKRFIFVSTVKVNGEKTVLGKPFIEDAIPNPSDSYALSKYEAEIGLKSLCEQSGMEYVIIRPALIYGPGVKANYKKLIDHIRKGFPLPFGCIKNKRSMLAVDNLVDFIFLAASHPAASNQTFMLSDGEDLSSKDLAIKISRALNTRIRIFPMPIIILKIIGILTGRRSGVERLISSLQVDSSKSRELLSWTPRISVDEGIALTINFLSENEL